MADTTFADLPTRMPATLAGEPLELVAPGSLAERWDIAIYAAQDPPMHRLMAAALGLCWPRLRRRLPYRGDAAAYGGAVLDAVLGAKTPAAISDIALPGMEALRLCTEGLVPVEGADAFSDPPADGTPAGDE